MPSNLERQGVRAPSPNALFSLVPVNRRAEEVVGHDSNSWLVSISPKSKVLSFDIGFHINSQYSINTLATLGRDDCDIYLQPASIARTHCSFEIDDLNTGIVMLYDRSHKHNTQISGKREGKPFEEKRSPRKILVHPGFNDKISLGGTNGDLFKFQLEWIVDEVKLKELAVKHRDARKDSITNPRKARTRDPTMTVLPSMKMTPDQAFQKPGELAMRYYKRKLLGTGSFGKVWRIIDVDSGHVMAMKHLQWVPGLQKQDNVATARKEVELMRRAKHENIADLVTSQGWEDGSSSIKIFMGLEEGSLDGLGAAGKFTLKSGSPDQCLQQMLSALDFLAFKGIVHRDVKPDNILYSRPLRGPGYHFRLADFGVGKLEKYAYSCQGTHWYMAPEILRLRDRSDSDSIIKERQSPKVDIWSLFVSIAHARDVCNYRERSKNTNEEILNAAREACTEKWMSKYSDMAIEDPGARASAFDILSRDFDGIGVCDRDPDTDMSNYKNDEIFMDPRLLQNIQNARTPQDRRRSERNRRPFKMDHNRVEKRTSSIHTRTRPNHTC